MGEKYDGIRGIWNSQEQVMYVELNFDLYYVTLQIIDIREWEM